MKRIIQIIVMIAITIGLSTGVSAETITVSPGAIMGYSSSANYYNHPSLTCSLNSVAFAGMPAWCSSSGEMIYVGLYQAKNGISSTPRVTFTSPGSGTISLYSLGNYYVGVQTSCSMGCTVNLAIN